MWRSKKEQIAQENFLLAAHAAKMDTTEGALYCPQRLVEAPRLMQPRLNPGGDEESDSAGEQVFDGEESDVESNDLDDIVRFRAYPKGDDDEEPTDMLGRLTSSMPFDSLPRQLVKRCGVYRRRYGVCFTKNQ